MTGRQCRSAGKELSFCLSRLANSGPDDTGAKKMSVLGRTVCCLGVSQSTMGQIAEELQCSIICDAPLTEAFINDGSSRHVFVGTVSSLSPAELAEAISATASAGGDSKDSAALTDIQSSFPQPARKSPITTKKGNILSPRPDRAGQRRRHTTALPAHVWNRVNLTTQSHWR